MTEPQPSAPIDYDLWQRLAAVELDGISFAAALPNLIARYIAAGLDPVDIATACAMYHGHAIGGGGSSAKAVTETLQCFANVMTDSARLAFATTSRGQGATLQ